MSRLQIAATVAAALLAPPAVAQGGADALYDALRLDDVVAIMREEGLEYGGDLEAELFPGDGGRAWAAVVDDIYGIAAMQEGVAQAFAAELDPEDVPPLVAFFTSPRGREIVDLEIEARRALRDEAAEDAAAAQARRMREADDPRMDRLRTFVEVNDLVEGNVVGALNSNYAFYEGLIAGGALADGMSRDQVLGDVWAQEPEIRADTIDWVYGYVSLAYEPLSADDLDVYIALSRTPEGQALNAALFAAFDAMYADISHRLGRQAAVFMQGEDI